MMPPVEPLPGLFSDVKPLRALRPSFVRPTTLELGPLGPAITSAQGSDVVRTPFERPTTDDASPRSRLGGRQNIVVTGGTRDRTRARDDVAAATRKTFDGHSEAVLTVMREFFQSRPFSVLLDVFRDQDIDQSGEIDVDEFKRGLRKLNLNLHERDMEAVFRAADKDDSGAIDLDEFFNTFRTDNFPRQTFFWDQTRPRGLLDRNGRIALAQARARLHLS